MTEILTGLQTEMVAPSAPPELWKDQGAAQVATKLWIWYFTRRPVRLIQLVADADAEEENSRTKSPSLS
jgi:hypothetical protein